MFSAPLRVELIDALDRRAPQIDRVG